MNRTSCYTHTWLKDYLPTLPLDISTPFFLSFFLSLQQLWTTTRLHYKCMQRKR
ncbi:hypothetical protein Peur_050371 [Populus x canadensis]